MTYLAGAAGQNGEVDSAQPKDDPIKQIAKLDVALTKLYNQAVELGNIDHGAVAQRGFSQRTFALEPRIITTVTSITFERFDFADGDVHLYDDEQWSICYRGDLLPDFKGILTTIVQADRQGAVILSEPFSELRKSGEATPRLLGDDETQVALKCLINYFAVE